MHSDSSSLITQVQLALVGVILVVGLFFLWRAVCRIEEKVDSLKNATCTPGRVYNSYNDDEAVAAAEKIMQEVFGNSTSGAGADTYVVYQATEDAPVKSDINIEEVMSEPPEPEQEQEETGESESDVNPLSKTKLKKMSVDELKELCRQRGLPTDGPKTTLVDRVMGLSRDI